MDAQLQQKIRLDFDSGKFYDNNGNILETKKLGGFPISYDFLFEEPYVTRIFENNEKDFFEDLTNSHVYAHIFYKDKGAKLVLSESGEFLEKKNVIVYAIQVFEDSDSFFGRDIVGYAYKAEDDDYATELVFTDEVSDHLFETEKLM